jgi:hypothetical protein
MGRGAADALIVTGCTTASVFSAGLSCLLAKVQLDRRNKSLWKLFRKAWCDYSLIRFLSARSI